MCLGVDFGNLTQQIYFFDPKIKEFFFRIQLTPNFWRCENKLRVVRSRQHHDGTYMAILSSEKKDNFHFSLFEHNIYVAC